MYRMGGCKNQSLTTTQWYIAPSDPTVQPTPDQNKAVNMCTRSRLWCSQESKRDCSDAIVGRADIVNALRTTAFLKNML